MPGTIVTMGSGQPPEGGTPPAAVPGAAPGGNPPAGNAGTGQPPAPGTTAQTWEAFFDTLAPEVKALYEQHTSGLRNALQSERDQRGELAKQIKELAGKQKDGSDERKALDEMSKSLEAANARADFFEEAARPEIGCRNPRLAWLAVQSGEGYLKRGRVDWPAVKADYPELFTTPAQGVPRGNAGAGTGTQLPASPDMNQMIRKAAGRS